MLKNKKAVPFYIHNCLKKFICVALNLRYICLILDSTRTRRRTWSKAQTFCNNSTNQNIVDKEIKNRSDFGICLLLFIWNILSSFHYLKALAFKYTNIHIFKSTKLILHAVLYACKASPATSSKMYNLKCDGTYFGACLDIPGRKWL
jgi:hypothetical protein